jgi:hypothetical protein
MREKKSRQYINYTSCTYTTLCMALNQSSEEQSNQEAEWIDNFLVQYFID